MTRAGQIWRVRYPNSQVLHAPSHTPLFRWLALRIQAGPQPPTSKTGSCTGWLVSSSYSYLRYAHGQWSMENDFRTYQTILFLEESRYVSGEALAENKVLSVPSNHRSSEYHVPHGRPMVDHPVAHKGHTLTHTHTHTHTHKVQNCSSRAPGCRNEPILRP